MTFLGWLSDLLERLSDLQLGDQKVTLNHLVVFSSHLCISWFKNNHHPLRHHLRWVYTGYPLSFAVHANQIFPLACHSKQFSKHNGKKFCREKDATSYQMSVKKNKHLFHITNQIAASAVSQSLFSENLEGFSPSRHHLFDLAES